MPNNAYSSPAISELAAARNKSSLLMLAVFLFSIFVNLLMLTGPLFMLQIYDRVLGSRSEETLAALFVLVALLYAMMGVLDYARGRVLARFGARFQSLLDQRVFEAVLKRAIMPIERAQPSSGLQNLEAVQFLFSSPVLLAVLDIPWTPVFLAAIFIFHPMLGWLAVAGGATLIVVTFLNQYFTRTQVLEAQIAAQSAHRFAEETRAANELVKSQGMHSVMLKRWKTHRDAALSGNLGASDRTGVFLTTTKTFRFFLQSAMLALGAFLVLKGEMTAGAMIAGSIMLGRALAPIEQAIGQWTLVQRARTGWRELTELLATTPPDEAKTDLPPPASVLEVKGLVVVPPGSRAALLQNINFRLEPGQALGVIGKSGAGKTTLARALLGIWPPAQGEIRLGGASLSNYDPDVLGGYIGYLPQQVTLFDGTISENIARMAEEPNAQKVVDAAQRASAHNLILNFPGGYDTRIEGGDGSLSGGQRQRIGLARAMFGDPVLLILDEPNSALDSEGANDLNKAIREYKAKDKCVIVMTHRPAAIAECDVLLVLDQGKVVGFGPRDEVLKSTVQNASNVQQMIKKKGAS